MSTQRSMKIAMAAAGAVGFALLVLWLRATAPAPTGDVSVADLLPPDDEVTCEELERDDAPPTASGGDASAIAGRATSGAVLTCPFAFDGLQVLYVGEVVGDVLARDGGSWVLMNDDSYALGEGPLTAGGTPRGTNSGLSVWLPDPHDELADEPGRPGMRGDVLVVTGTVMRADPADGGGLTIRAQDVELLADAAAVEEPVHWRQLWIAVALGLAALVVLWRERTRRTG